jgi:hypothetical protein
MNQYATASYLEAEVKCYHCGHISGVLRRDREARGPAVFLASGGAPAVAVRSLTALHCARCQGSVYTDEFDVRYVYPKVEFTDEAPRRGRPPKRLAELRRSKEGMRKSA